MLMWSSFFSYPFWQTENFLLVWFCIPLDVLFSIVRVEEYVWNVMNHLTGIFLSPLKFMLHFKCFFQHTGAADEVKFSSESNRKSIKFLVDDALKLLTSGTFLKFILEKTWLFMMNMFEVLALIYNECCMYLAFFISDSNASSKAKARKMKWFGAEIKLKQNKSMSLDLFKSSISFSLLHRRPMFVQRVILQKLVNNLTNWMNGEITFILQ